MLTIQSFVMNLPTRIQFGINSITGLGEQVKNCGGTKVFLAADPGLESAGVLEKIVGALTAAHLPYELYTAIVPEPGLELADRGASLAKAAGCDCVVGAGGGSAMDVAKAVSILLTNGGKAEDYLGLGRISKPGVPKIMIPTTAGTGAEVTFTAVFLNEKTRSKAGMNGDPLYPEAAILDPSLTVSLPPHVTAFTGIDALTHAIEAYVSIQAHTLSDLYAQKAIILIADNLAMAYARGDNMEARGAMLMGSLLAGRALATAGVGLVHAMAYPMGGMFNTPHGLANAVLLPYVMAYNLIGSPQKYAQIANALGCRIEGLNVREAGEMAVEALRILNDEIGIPRTLAELDIPFDRIPVMAEIALTVTRPVANNPRKPMVDDVISIYENAFCGEE